MNKKITLFEGLIDIFQLMHHDNKTIIWFFKLIVIAPIKIIELSEKWAIIQYIMIINSKVSGSNLKYNADNVQ